MECERFSIRGEGFERLFSLVVFKVGFCIISSSVVRMFNNYVNFLVLI